MSGHIEGLRVIPLPAAAPVNSNAVLALLGQLLSLPLPDRPNWISPRLPVEMATKSANSISKTQLRGADNRAFRWRRPRHCLHERQDAQVEWAEAAPTDAAGRNRQHAM